MFSFLGNFVTSAFDGILHAVVRMNKALIKDGIFNKRHEFKFLGSNIPNYDPYLFTE